VRLKGAAREKRTMNKTIKVAATLSIAGVLALTGCGGDSDASDGGGTTLNLVGYSVLEQANKGVISAFEKTDAGQDVSVEMLIGANPGVL
jgi:sulfate transport system substrate-binding protein